MNAIVASVADAAAWPAQPVRAPLAYPDPLDHDLASDEVVVTTRRGLVRVALVATEVATRFQREGTSLDPMAWMLSPRDVFHGIAAVEACVDRDACLRGTLLHGLALGLDADPAEIDALIDDDDEHALPDTMECMRRISPPQDPKSAARSKPRSKCGIRAEGGSRNGNVLSFGPKREPVPRLFTATVVHDDGFETVHAFHASFAVDEAEIAGRLYMRMGAAAADAAIVTGFDHTSPIVEALVSQAICDTLMMIDAEQSSPLAAGLDLNIEQRFAA